MWVGEWWEVGSNPCNLPFEQSWLRGTKRGKEEEEINDKKVLSLQHCNPSANTNILILCCQVVENKRMGLENNDVVDMNMKNRNKFFEEGIKILCDCHWTLTGVLEVCRFGGWAYNRRPLSRKFSINVLDFIIESYKPCW